jgi:hypothetical protein
LDERIFIFIPAICLLALSPVSPGSRKQREIPKWMRISAALGVVCLLAAMLEYLPVGLRTAFSRFAVFVSPFLIIPMIHTLVRRRYT